MTSGFHLLTVAETREELDGAARTVIFDVPVALQDAFSWRAGQHLTVRFTIDGQEHRRSYSISASPDTGEPLRITVKRVKGGVVSNHINDKLEAGDEVDVMPPLGGFCLDPGPLQRRTHYFFGAGSGITPLYAMIGSVMVAEPHSVAHLVVGNVDAGQVLLNDELTALQQTHPDRLTLHHVLSKPGWWSDGMHWRTGRVDAGAVEAMIAENPPYAQDAQYYICGPGGMNPAVRDALMGLDVPAERIHMESYGGQVEQDTSQTGVVARARVSLGGQTHELAIAEDQTILEAARAAGLTPPYSCQSGVCGACKAHLSKGRAHLRARMALEDREIERGAVLTCQAVALSDELELTFDRAV